MSYKVQRPFPSAPGAPAVAAGDALPGPAWGVPVGGSDPSARPPLAPCRDPAWPQPCQPSAGPSAGGPAVGPYPGAGSSLGLQDPPSVRGVPVPVLPELLQCPPASHHTPAVLGREAVSPRGFSASPRLGGPGRLPPHGAFCSRRWPWAAGAKAQMPPHRLPRRCHLRARGCQAGGATAPPGHPTPAPGHCSMAGCRAPQNGVLRALGVCGEGSGTLQGGRKWGRLGCLPASLPL